MACPTCSATMQKIGQDDRGDNFFHCPRCGTVKVDAFGRHGDRVYVPALVLRCRQFEANSIGTIDPNPRLNEPHQNAWNALGLPEAINTPEDRP